MDYRFFSRRDLFGRSSLLGLLPAFLGGGKARAQTASVLRIGPDIYQSIGVRPLINCKGTFTIISGSQSLPEVKQAMEAASRHYVHLDELMEAVGRRLAELTQAEWGIVTCGCASALSHATAACIAGTDPEKLQRLPDTHGLKDEVIVPGYSRNVYDHAVRGAGARFIEVNTKEEYLRAFNDRTAMIMVLAGPGDNGPLGLPILAPIAREKGVPILVDAAAERLTIPNVHLARGATMVAYSGGKCLRGPQSAGLLLGRKDLVQAAWLHSAPHHAFGRPMKAGKEEIMGMLAAVEAWVKRNHEAEWNEWEHWLQTIADKVTQVEGVTTRILQPEGLSNNAPQLQVSWDGEKSGISGADVAKQLLEGNPRVILGAASGDRRRGIKNSSLTIMPYMMMPGDAAVAAERIHAVLTTGARSDLRAKISPTVNVTGQWDVDIRYSLGKSSHRFVFEQRDADLVGTHSGEFLGGDVQGTVEGDEVWVRSSHKYEGTRLGYEFVGKVSENVMEGTVDMGEYGQARWVAKRHQYGRPNTTVRPVKNV